jgi:hypothetical protein
MLDMPTAQPLSSQSTGTLQNKNPYLSTNPFGMPVQHNNVMLDQAFQSLSLAPSQPLFPHHTGGVAAQQQQQLSQHQAQPDYGQSLFQQTTTSPMPSMTQNLVPGIYSPSQTYPQPNLAAPTAYNPFFTNQQAQQPLTVNTTAFAGNFGNNPFTRSPTRIQSPALTQIPEQAPQNFYSQPPPPQATNPFFSHMAGAGQAPMQHMAQTPPQLQQQPGSVFTQSVLGQMPQAPQPMAPQRPDKASIMALYSYPQLAPTPFQTQNTTQTAANTLFSSQTFPQAAPQLQQQQQPQPPQQPQQPSAVAGPTAGSKNPFLGSGAAQPTFADSAAKHHISRDSMMAIGLEWTNGRHSPDAFASLSSRDMH